MKKILVRGGLTIVKLLLLFGVILLLYRIGGYAYDFGYQLYSNKGAEAAPGRDLAVVIYEDQTPEEIAEMLEKFGLIKDKRVFLVQERLSRFHGEMIPGNYVLNTSYSGNQIIEILAGQEKETKESEENNR